MGKARQGKAKVTGKEKVPRCLVGSVEVDNQIKLRLLLPHLTLYGLADCLALPWPINAAIPSHGSWAMDHGPVLSALSINAYEEVGSLKKDEIIPSGLTYCVDLTARNGGALQGG